jgi:hypothetical protein
VVSNPTRNTLDLEIIVVKLTGCKRFSTKVMSEKTTTMMDQIMVTKVYVIGVEMKTDFSEGSLSTGDLISRLVAGWMTTH